MSEQRNTRNATAAVTTNHLDTREGRTATEISRDASAARATPAQRIEAELGKARRINTKVADAKDAASKAIFSAAEDVLEAVDVAMEAVDAALKRKQAKVDDATRSFSRIPVAKPKTEAEVELNKATATVRDAAARGAAADALKASEAELQAAAEEVSRACASFEMTLEHQQMMSNPALANALQGEHAPEEASSIAELATQLSGAPMAQVARFYDVLLRAEKDQAVLFRFEVAALRAIAARVEMSENQLFPYAPTSRDQAKREPERAKELAKKIVEARAKRIPASVRIAETELLPQIRECTRLLMQADRAHFDATGATTDQVLAQRTTWGALPNWFRRFGL